MTENQFNKGFAAGREAGREEVWREIFGKSSCDYSWSRQQYSISVPFAYSNIDPNALGIELACKYNEKFRKMYMEEEAKEAQREKEQYGE